MAYPDFNPANATMRTAHEATPGLSPAAGWVDHSFSKVGFANEPDTIENDSIYGGGQRTPSLPSKIKTDGALTVNLDAEGHAIHMANLQKKVTTTSPSAGVYLHRLGPTEDDPVATTLSSLVNMDDGMPQSFRGGRISSAKFSLKPKGLLTADFEHVWTRSDYWGLPVVVADPSATPVPHVRGFPSLANWQLADGDLYFKVTDITGLPTSVLGKVKVGAASAYGVGTFTATIGLDANGEPVWNVALDGAGARIGDRALEVEIHLPSVTGLAVDDEWKIPRERLLWTQDAVPDVPVFNEIFAAIYIDGASYCLDGFDLTIAPPVQPQECIGGRFPKRVLERGQREVTVEISRDYISTKLRKILERGASFHLRMEAYGGVPFVTGFEHFLKINLPMCVPKGRTPTIESSTELKEKIEADCYPDAANGLGYFDDATIEIQNSIADIATAA